MTATMTLKTKVAKVPAIKVAKKPAPVKPVISEAEFLTNRENEVRKTYKRVIEGSIRREKTGPHAGKITVEIKCATPDCPNTRRVATSDLFQVKYCEECTQLRRNSKRRKARKETTKAKTAPVAVTKVRKARKAKVPVVVTPAVEGDVVVETVAS